MWNDIETTDDYLHFSVVSGTVAELIDESGDNPISIGVSGNWGTGKSSMVKMIGKELEKSNKAEKTTYIFWNLMLGSIRGTMMQKQHCFTRWLKSSQKR